MGDRQVRIGIDVGGTFTKAVVIDNKTLEIIGKSSVLTTHSAAEGVAQGVVYVFRRALEDFQIDPRSVVFLAHSTTQATNALLEGRSGPGGDHRHGQRGVRRHVGQEPDGGGTTFPSSPAAHWRLIIRFSARRG